jgi:nucleotide-binding universal stress UspA family protein
MEVAGMRGAVFALTGRATMFENILALIPTERSVRPVIDVVISLATARRSHLDAIAIGYESMSSAELIIEGGAAVAAVMEMEHERALERANAAITIFEVEARLANILYDTRVVAATPVEAGEIAGTLSRLYDLTVVLQPEHSSSSYDNMIPQAVLFNSGGPMLMIPYIHKGDFDTRHVGIAWDGSRLAARALRDAQPFLTAAETVTVIAINEDRKNASDVTCNQVVSHLARHGIKADIERLTAEYGNVQGTILSILADKNIGLLVMGGYGHSQFRERILGGVTRSMFDSTTVPVLMSH